MEYFPATSWKALWRRGPRCQLSQAKLKARTDKCNAEHVKPAQEGSQKGISGSRLTTALVEDELDEDGISNAREVIAGAREQIDITSKLVEAKMKTAAEPHVKEELNHMLQNDTAPVNGQKEFLADSHQVLGSRVKVKAVDAAADWSVEAETQMQNKKLQRK